MKRKFNKIGFEGINIIVKIGSPTQKVEYKVDCPKPNVIYQLDFKVYFFHLGLLNYNNCNKYFFRVLLCNNNHFVIKISVLIKKMLKY
jgi:hypothetical protein